MLTKRIIPCLDVTGGRVVKGTSFVNLRDAGDPVELARFYDREGADELVFLDITASADKRDTIIDVVQKVSEQVFIPLTVGGGVRSPNDVRKLLNAGADKVSMNSAAVLNPDSFKQAASAFGNQCMVIAIDARRCDREDAKTGENLSQRDANGIDADLVLEKNSEWEVYINGGRTPTGIDVLKWAQYMSSLGAGEILLTSMDEDGQKNGFDLALTRKVSDSVSIPVIASGGAGNAHHLLEAITEGHADAVLAASIFHYGEYSIESVKKLFLENNVPARVITN
tara:strand:- start:3631 stop:4476 length:846 start_codon:yes stop_codon:yes gene_type:complete